MQFRAPSERADLYILFLCLVKREDRPSIRNTNEHSERSRSDRMPCLLANYPLVGRLTHRFLLPEERRTNKTL